jgi:transposase-like protein
VLIREGADALCPACQQTASKRNGLDRYGRQKYACRPCRRTFTENTLSAFSGYRWPRDVIIMAVRWYLAYPLSSRQVLELLAERDVSHRTVLNWSRRSDRSWLPRYDASVVRSAGVGS